MSRARRRRPGRSEAPEEVQFPVTPMLDMAFQLLAFFILTFQAPTPETHLDLYLPAAPAALPGAARGQAEPTRRDGPTSTWRPTLVRAEADDLGDLKSLRLGEAAVPDLDALGDRLRRYARSWRASPLRVRLVADDRLRYEEAARLIAPAPRPASPRSAWPTRPAPGPVGARRGPRHDRPGALAIAGAGRCSWPSGSRAPADERVADAGRPGRVPGRALRDGRRRPARPRRLPRPLGPPGAISRAARPGRGAGRPAVPPGRLRRPSPRWSRPGSSRPRATRSAWSSPSRRGRGVRRPRGLASGSPARSSSGSATRGGRGPAGPPDRRAGGRRSRRRPRRSAGREPSWAIRLAGSTGRSGLVVAGLVVARPGPAAPATAAARRRGPGARPPPGVPVDDRRRPERPSMSRPRIAAEARTMPALGPEAGRPDRP